MTNSLTKNKKSPEPFWLQELRGQGKRLFYSSSGHVWLRFHKWAFMRFPPHDVAPLEKNEERELFFSAMAPIISHHHLPRSDEKANAVLYLCRDKEYDLSKLSANNRSKVRRGQKRMEVRRISSREIAENGYVCYYDTCVRNGIAPVSEKEFKTKWRKDQEPSCRELWAACVGNKIAATGVVWNCGKWSELLSTQSADEYLKDYSNNVLFYTILNDLLHREEVESVSYGLSSLQPNSKMTSLHHFKLSVNLEAVPVVRKITINPLLRVAFNSTTLAGVQYLEKAFPNVRHLLAARGALEMVINGNVSTVERDCENELRPIEARDAKEIAAIHRQVFPDYNSTRLGVEFCAELYRAYAEMQEAFGFVVRRGGEPIGFVVGGDHDAHSRINQKLRGRAFVALLTNPKLAVETVLEKITRTSSGAKSSSQTVVGLNGDKSDRRCAAKLILIGVSEKARGTGVAAELMKKFRSEAAARGFEQVMLIVRRDNARARAAYEKTGWTAVDKGGESVEYYISANDD